MISVGQLPEGDHGVGPIGPTCIYPSNESECVAEEWHIIPLTQSNGFYTVSSCNIKKPFVFEFLLRMQR